MKVGDYVRFDGEIAKITDIKRYKTKEDIYFFDRILDLNEDRACNDNTICNGQWKYFDNVKSSSNIIDLIEVGDYVNGHRVSDIYEDIDGQIRMKFSENGLVLAHKSNYDNYYLFEEDIKSIITKEQFESMEYKL